MDININNPKHLHIDISQVNKIKNSDLEPDEDRIAVPQINKSNKDVDNVQEKLSSWLDEVENSTNVKLSTKQPTTFDKKVKDAQDGKIKGNDFEKYLESLYIGYKASPADSEGNYTISFQYNGNEYDIQVNDPERANSVSKDTSVIGKGSWSTEQLNKVGFKLPNEYFTQVYTDYYKFNTGAITRDLPGWPINTLTDLQIALGAKSDGYTVVGNGSWNTEQINQSGLADYGKYFTGVYSNWYKFNSETIKQDFPGRYINTLADLKTAIEDLKNTEISQSQESEISTNTGEIETDLLFNETDEISPSDLVKNIDSLLKSDNPAIVEFAQKLENLSNEYGINNHYDQEDLFKCLIMFMNKSAGIENSYPVTLTKDTVEELNKNGFFTQLDKIAKSEDLKNEYYFGVDGYIDNFAQKDLGDCWLLAGILALNSSDIGKDIIKDSINKITKKDENGNNKEYIRVTFKGIGMHYDISYEEMEEARTLDITYWYNGSSDGDNDVLALELATERLRRDIRSGKILLPYGIFTNESDIWASDNGHGGILKGGYQGDMLFYLTGNTPEMDKYTSTAFPKEEVIDFLNDLYEGFNKGSLVGYFSLGNADTQALTTDNKEFSWRNGGHHAFAIVDMTIAEPSDTKNNTVTIANPWYPDEPYTFTWEEFSNIKMDRIGIVSTELHEHNYVKNYYKTEFENTIDYNAKVNINEKDYTINDIIKSQEPILYETKDSVDTDCLIYDILTELLSDIEPEIRNNITNVLWNIYENLAHKLDLSNPNAAISFVSRDYQFNLYSYMANDYGVSNGENGTTIDVKRMIQKAVELCETYTREPMNLEDYEEKLQNGEFDKQIGELEMMSYLEEYKELLINDISSKYEYSEGFIQLIHSCLSVYARNEKPERDENGKFNLQEALNRIKNQFEQYTNPSEEEITSLNIEVSWNQGIGSFKTFINDIVRDAYNSNKDKIHAKDLADFKQKLIEYIANNYGLAEELKKNGVINLANIPDINGDGNWVDEFYQIVHDFAHKDDDALINYYKEFELDGRKYNLNGILSSNNAGSISITNREVISYLINDMVDIISEVLQNIDETVVKNIKSTLFECYYNFADLSWSRETYYYGKEIELNNYITGEKNNIRFNYSVAEEYGISGGNGYFVEIDIKTLTKKFLELVEQATGSV